jgi:hypothetical protein
LDSLKDLYIPVAVAVAVSLSVPLFSNLDKKIVIA